MNPTIPVPPTSPLGYPAPFWFIEFFKVLGFTLHLVPMNLWFAGMVLIAMLSLLGRGHARTLAHRLVRVMPIVIALGVNFGIVPLLFTQVAYYQAFYPATILMAWPWFSIIALLTLAYYGVYVYATQVRRDNIRPWGLAAGWLSALFFVVIGFIFSNNFTLMTNANAWAAILNRASVAGAPTGLALNLGDPRLLPRWLMVFGMALTTTATYVIVDTAFFAAAESVAYRNWAARFAFRLYSLGLVWFGVMGAWYLLGTTDPAVLNTAVSQPVVLILLAAAAVSPGAVWLLAYLQRDVVIGRLATLAGVAQFMVLAFNAISRQWVQNAEISQFLLLGQEQVNMQWSPLILFLLLFVVGVAVVAWMVWQVVQVHRQPATGGA